MADSGGGAVCHQRRVYGNYGRDSSEKRENVKRCEVVRKSIDSSALCCDVYFDSDAEYSEANCEYVDCIERFSAFDVIYTVYSGVQKNIERSIISCKKEFGMRKQIELFFSFFSCDLQCLLEPINDVRCVQCLLDNMQNIRLHFLRIVKLKWHIV